MKNRTKIRLILSATFRLSEPSDYGDFAKNARVQRLLDPGDFQTFKKSSDFQVPATFRHKNIGEKWPWTHTRVRKKADGKRLKPGNFHKIRPGAAFWAENEEKYKICLTGIFCSRILPRAAFFG